MQKLFTPGEAENWTVEGKPVTVFGFAGNASAVHVIKASLTDGVKHNTKPTDFEGGFQSLLICKDGSVFCWSYVKDKKKQEERNDLVIVTGPYAIGSGAVMAESAMSIGLDAEQAIKAAIKLDIMSGGAIQVYELWKNELSWETEGDNAVKTLLEQMKSIVNKPVNNNDQIIDQLHEAAELLAEREIYPK